MAIKIEYMQVKEKKRVPAIKHEGFLSSELGEALVEMYPDLLETGVPLNKISRILWDKK